MPANPTPQAPQNAMEGDVCDGVLKDAQNGSTGKKSGFTGSTLDSFLDEEGMLTEVELKAIERVRDWLAMYESYRAALARGVWWG